MGLRFRRSWGVVPGVRLNLGLKSGSVSFGGRGLHYTVGTRGQRVTVGLPGTGLFWTQKINSPFGTAQAGRASQAHGYAQRATPGSPHAGVTAQLSAPQTLHPLQFTQLNLPRTQSPPTAGGAGQAAPATHSSRVFVPVWLVWGVLAVIAISALCFAAGVIGQHLR